MDELYIKLSALLISFVSLTKIIIKVSKHFEESASTEAKNSTSGWLHNINLTTALTKVADPFVSVFDRIFGERHFTLKCIVRSSIASVCAVIFFTLLWIVLNYDAATAFFLEETEGWFATTPAQNMKFLVILGVVFNLIPDYFSLLESRFILGYMKTKSNLYVIVTLLVADLIVTVLIFILLGALLMELITIAFVGKDSLLSPIGEYFKLVVDISKSLLDEIKALLKGEPSFFIIFFFSTFFTSFWVWLYVVSAVLYKLIKPIKKLERFFKWFLDIENKPFVSIGNLMILVIALGYLVSVPFII